MASKDFDTASSLAAAATSALAFASSPVVPPVARGDCSPSHLHCCGGQAVAHVFTHHASLAASAMLVHVLGSAGLKGSAEDSVKGCAVNAVSCGTSSFSAAPLSLCTDRPAASVAPHASSTLRSGMAPLEQQRGVGKDLPNGVADGETTSHRIALGHAVLKLGEACFAALVVGSRSPSGVRSVSQPPSRAAHAVSSSASISLSRASRASCLARSQHGAPPRSSALAAPRCPPPTASTRADRPCASSAPVVTPAPASSPAAASSSTASVCPAAAAACSAVRPAPSRAPAEAPARSSTRSIARRGAASSGSSPAATDSSGVAPSLEAVSSEAAAVRRARTTSRRPRIAAMCSGVTPFQLRASVAAPCVSSRLVTTRLPLSAATNSGVTPICVSAASTAAPSSIRARHAAWCPPCAARYSAEAPYMLSPAKGE
eukprot:scaffold23465_cov63-Phaeocystis_antarctica.AAC.2